MNKVIHIGRLTKDVELRRTADGKAVAVFSMAVNKDYKNAQGGYDADFFDYVAFEQKAEAISKYVHKGDKFFVLGRLEKRSYEKEGRTIWSYQIRVLEFEFLESKKQDASGFEPIDECDDECLPF